MKNIAVLMDGVYAVNELATKGQPFWPQEDGRTFCNEAVNLVCMKFSITEFSLPTKERPFGAVLANQMVGRMEESDKWRKVTSSEGAQALANQGGLVVAAIKNPSGHGHVAIVVPGSMEFSSSWNGGAPKLLNVGKTNFLGRKASFAFSKDDMPVYYTTVEEEV